MKNSNNFMTEMSEEEMKDVNGGFAIVFILLAAILAYTIGECVGAYTNNR